MVKPRKIPSYGLHKASGLARARFPDIGDRYFGKHGTPESVSAYRWAVSEWLGTVPGGPYFDAAEPAAKHPSSVFEGPASINVVVLAFFSHAQQHYPPTPDGGPSHELTNIKVSVRPLVQLYGSTPAAEFGPKALRSVRERMIRDGLARTTINDRINRIRRIFRWAASHEMVPPLVLVGLKAVEALPKGRTDARETEDVGPVSRDDVARTIPALTRPIAGMVRMQLLTGMRPGEVCLMRGRDIARDGETWTYRPARHKNQWRGKARDIVLGPQAQALVEEYAKEDPDAYLFDPRDVPARGRFARLKGKYRRYSRNAYTNAVWRGCRKAGVAGWSPNQLRHTFATEVRASHGLEAAQAILGHSRADTTQIYAERDTAKARDVIGRIG